MALTDRQYFTLRRLQSLLGVVPVGLFLLEHWFTNAFALAGRGPYNDKVEFLRSLPYLYLLEIFGIALPILFHALIGIWIAWEAKFNNRSLPYRQNWMFLLQRVTGLVLLFYIPYHVITTRFSGHTTDLFALMHEKLQHPLVFLFYLFGVLAASFHFGNGLWGFAIHWGLLTSRRAQRTWSWAALGVALALAVTGVNSLLAFEPLGLRPVMFQPGEPPSTRALAPPASDEVAR